MKSFLPDKVYEVLKWIALVALNAIGQLYEGLAKVWDLPYGPQIAKTCALVSICLGILIGVSTYQYRKSQSSETQAEGKVDGKE